MQKQKLNILRVIVAFIAAAGSAQAATPVERAAEQILRHQASDGAIVMGALPAEQSHLIPYCGNLAARGLVVAYRETGTKRYLEAARAWIGWYEAHQNDDGTIYDFNGAPGAWKPTGDYDSTDSYAATYLDLVSAIYLAAQDPAWLRARKSAARQAVAAICLTLQPQGMTSAKPKWPVMYLMANLMAAAWMPTTERQRRLLTQLKKQFQAEIPAAICKEDDLDHLVWWGLAARSVGDQALWRDVVTKLTDFDKQISHFANPALLGHLCRVNARR